MAASGVRRPFPAGPIALAALWLGVALAGSLLTLHLCMAAVRGQDLALTDTGSAITRMSEAMVERGAPSSDIIAAIGSAAKTHGLDVTVKALPKPMVPPNFIMRPLSADGDRHIPERVEVMMPPPSEMFGLPDPSMAPAMIMHVGQDVVFISSHDDVVERIIRSYVILMIVLVACAVGSTWYVYDRMLRRAIAPARTIEAALRRLSGGEYAKLEVIGTEPQETAIAQAYNAAADELASSIRLRAEAESNLRLFVADAGHELRTPLTVIMGFVDVLRQGAIAEQAVAQRILESVAAEGERMRILISKLLLLARLDAVAPERFEHVDLSRVAADIVESFRPLAGATALDVAAEPDVAVVGSVSEVRETVGILVDNALKYAPGSHVRIAVGRDDRHGVLTIADDGPGMPPDLQARAFDRFSRGDDRGSIPGSGLGLAIVKRIATRAGGDVDLVSALGKGTLVRVRFPLAPA